MSHISSLTERLLGGYIDLLGGPPQGIAPEQYLTLLAAKLADPESALHDVIVAADDTGRLHAAVRLIPLAGSTYILSGPRVAADTRTTTEEYEQMIARALDRARLHLATKLETRQRDDQSDGAFTVALESSGFRRIGKRIEFRASVETLPSEKGSPLRWRTMEETGTELAAEMLALCSIGDPHSSEEDDPTQAITEFLDDPALTSSPDCVQIGYLDERPVAFACAQVMPSSGWSRIAYMGLAPDVRGKGLGQWVHRHGFEMIRAQGGTLYHGGTAADNAPMLALFAAHGCAELARMTDWELRLA